jgi:hypothetical protein
MVGSSACRVQTSTVYAGSGSFIMDNGINWSAPGPEWPTLGTDAKPVTYELAINTAGTGYLMTPPMLPGGAFSWPGFELASGRSGIKCNYNSGSVTIPFTAGALTVSTWYSIAVAIKGSTHHTFGLWLDGVWQGEATMSNPIVTQTGVIETDLNIGRSSGNSQYIGYLDEIRASNELFLPWGQDYLVDPPFPDGDSIQRQKVIPEAVTYVDANTCTVTFTTAQIGFAEVI